MMYNESCSMHDAHAEAVENVFELDSTIIQKFVEIIDINKLRALGNWMVGKFKTARSYAEYLLINGIIKVLFILLWKNIMKQ